ncbi:MAG: ABC transporter permease [Cytophagaceae bacterium]
MKKEMLLLLRDKAGLAILFIMPLSLIILMALIQDAPFKDYQQAELSVLLIDEDQDTLSAAVEKSLVSGKMFKVNKIKKFPGEEEVKREVAGGKYKMAILIPFGASQALRSKAREDVERVFSPVDAEGQFQFDNSIQLFWDPEIKLPVKQSLGVALEKIVSGVQASVIISELSGAISSINPGGGKVDFKPGLVVKIQETDATLRRMPEFTLNSVQHNVPAWSVFGIFFIVLPLAGSIIKEREEGSIMRLKTLPVSMFTVLGGKIAGYLIVAVLQFSVMILAGIFLMPVLGLDKLDIGENYHLLFLVVLSIALAATGFGVLIGTIFKNHHQSSTFGAVAIVILGAIGGIWVPVFVMPEILRMLSLLSPLAWSMNAFNDLILRGGDISLILPEVISLIVFAGGSLLLASWYEKNHSVA